MCVLVVFFFVRVYTNVRFFFFFQAEDGIRDYKVTGVQTCALPICLRGGRRARFGLGVTRSVDAAKGSHVAAEEPIETRPIARNPQSVFVTPNLSPPAPRRSACCGTPRAHRARPAESRSLAPTVPGREHLFRLAERPDGRRGMTSVSPGSTSRHRR